ncbi:hypothetical protein BGZ98_010113 [Dissophora globulifera]|nr:hypothetical protein BGZ98_010113 [Dissophora globulifera]
MSAMSDSIAQDATPHPRHGGIRRRAANLFSNPFHSQDDDDSSSDNDKASSHPTSRPHSSQSSKGRDSPSSAAAGTRKGFRSSIFGHHSSAGASSKQRTGESDSDLDDDDDESNSEFDEEDSEDGIYGAGKRHSSGRRRRKRRVSASASHLLAQAPPVPDMRFDTNYRKALDQIYEAHARETATASEIAETTAARIAAVAAAAAAEHNDSALPGALPLEINPSIAKDIQIQSYKPRPVPSIAARVTVMTLRDIIIMPFIHGFFWGFGSILLTFIGQRSLVYHVRTTWSKIFGGNIEDTPGMIRGEPARVRRPGTGGFGGMGLTNAGSGIGLQQNQGFGRPAARVY